MSMTFTIILGWSVYDLSIFGILTVAKSQFLKSTVIIRFPFWVFQFHFLSIFSVEYFRF